MRVCGIRYGQAGKGSGYDATEDRKKADHPFGPVPKLACTGITQGLCRRIVSSWHFAPRITAFYEKVMQNCIKTIGNPRDNTTGKSEAYSPTKRTMALYILCTSAEPISDLRLTIFFIGMISVKETVAGAEANFFCGDAAQRPPKISLTLVR
jgi:hypothetical protein